MSTMLYLHKHFRGARTQREGTSYFWRELDRGIRLKYASAPNGNISLMSAWFPKEDFTAPQMRSWLAERDEVALALEADVKGSVFVRLSETFAGIDPTIEGAVLPSVDRANNVINHSLICGWKSLNNRNYVPVLRRAVSLYEGRPVSLNHPDPRKGVQVETRFGLYKSPYIDDKFGARGQLHYNPKHQLAEQIVWAAENQPSTICNSHRINAVGRVNRETGEFDVTDIDQVFGVELVADGGTTRGMFESAAVDDEILEGRLDSDDLPKGRSHVSMNGGSQMDLSNLTLESLRAQRGDLVQAIVEGLKASAEYEALVKKAGDLEEANTKLTEQIDTYKAKEALAERREAIKAKVVAAKLPDALVTETWLKSLERCENDVALDEQIADRKAIAGTASKPRVKSEIKPTSEQHGDTADHSGPVTTESFVNSLCQ